jgi:hypothetical protein
MERAYEKPCVAAILRRAFGDRRVLQLRERADASRGRQYPSPESIRTEDDLTARQVQRPPITASASPA